MKIFTKLLIAINLSLLLTNCTSSEFFTLKVEDDEFKYKMGRQIIEQEDSIAYSSISFEMHENKYFIFSYFVYNKSESDLVINPSNIYINYYDNNQIRINNTLQTAIDPEETISDIREKIDDRKDQHNVNTGVNVVVSLFSMIANLSDDNENDGEEVLCNTMATVDNQLSENESFSDDIDYLNSQNDYWTNSV